MNQCCAHNNSITTRQCIKPPYATEIHFMRLQWKESTQKFTEGLHAVNGTSRRTAGERARAHQLGTCDPSVQCGVLFLLFHQPGGCKGMRGDEEVEGVWGGGGGEEEGGWGVHDSRSPASRFCTQREQGVSVPPTRARGKSRRETREGGAVQVQPWGVHQ